MELTQKQIEAARDWIVDCEWPDLEPEEVSDLSNEQIIRGIRKNYDGGIRQFAIDFPNSIG